MTDRNQQLFDRAARVIPGGVNSPVRAFRAVGGTPRFVQRAQGAYFWDANGQKYIDYIGSWGPMILGHGHPAVVEAVQRAALDGFSFGAPTEREVQLAEAIIGLVKTEHGAIAIDDHDVSNASPHERLIGGLSYIPFDRHREGLLMDAPLWENTYLGREDEPSMSSGPFILKRKIEADSRNPTLIQTVWGGGYMLAAEVRRVRGNA